MSLPRRFRRLGSVAAGPLLLYGCAVRTVEFPGTDPRGHIAARPGKAGLVVAAPPGEADARTAEIAAEVARRTGFGLVVATGVAPGHDTRELYERRVREAARGPLRFYCEIHGNDRPDIAGRIEIATVGVSREFALRLRALGELIRDAHLRVHREAPSLAVLVAPADPLRSGVRRDGVLRAAERALRIELPRAARVEFGAVYAAILADFVAQAATLPEGR